MSKLRISKIVYADPIYIKISGLKPEEISHYVTVVVDKPVFDGVGDNDIFDVKIEISVLASTKMEDIEAVALDTARKFIRELAASLTEHVTS